MTESSYRPHVPRAVAHWAGGLLAFALVAACATAQLEQKSADAAEPGVGPIAVRADAVSLFPDDSGQVALGKLKFRGGVRLVASDGRFGGWSDLRVADDGRGVMLLSDHGYWLDAHLVHDATGNLTGLADARLGPLIDTGGKVVTRRLSDAEGLARRPDGGYVVSFEGEHRLWAYPAAEPPFSKSPMPLPSPPGAEAMPANGGIEALATLAGGGLLAIAEDLYDGNVNVGWIGDGRSWQRLTYRAAYGYNPTAIAGLPNGDALVLERRFSILGGFGARLARLKAADIGPGKLLVGEELARFERPVNVDNFEGVAVAKGSRGETVLYIVSDDNYQRMLQQTLLLMFELTD